MIRWIRLLSALFSLLIFPAALAAQSDSNGLPSNGLPSNDLPSNDLLTRVWDGVQQAQKKYTSSCGTIVETRTSSLMAKPLVLRGKFCAEGTTRFELEYSEPARVRIRYNDNYLNVTTGDKTEVLEVGSSVRRAQSYFSRESSIGNLKKNFTITVQEDSQDFAMKLVPRTDAFRRRLNYLVVKLDKRTFLLRSLEVDGKSGVNSVFAIDVNSLNPKIPAETFEVYKPN
ncbi:MAG: outer membrane lipoprotein carrier protein LolA [Candidatus Sulfotelmatobacter sp.]|jgi:outer membrane lipoprotein-sorting protein